MSLYSLNLQFHLFSIAFETHTILTAFRYKKETKMQTLESSLIL
jgi:hypothetical protein